MKKRIVALTLGLAVFGSCMVACNGKTDGNATVISMYNFDGGIGSEWLYASAKEFEKQAADKEYEPGKKGVVVEIDAAMDLNASTMDTSGYNIYLDEVKTNVRNFAAQNLLTDLTDVLTDDLSEFGENGTIESKIDSTFLSTLKGSDGKYYGLPYYETYPGLVYDIETFDKYNLYIAAPEETAVVPVTKFGKTVNFIGNSNAKKSCGNDGEYGTSDDGLPTSVVELLSLCHKMTSGGLSVAPFQITGAPSNQNYSTYLIEALWASLAGYDAMRTMYTFDGEIEAVVNNGSVADDFTSENMFGGIDYVKKPVTEKIRVQESTGYRIYDMVERYYAIAFLEIIEKEGWFSEDATSDSVTHTDAQNNFIFSLAKNKPMGMMIEGSYWYQESQRRGFFEDYYSYTKKTERKLGWMGLPTSLYDSVEEGKGRDLALLEMSHSYVTLNAASVKGNEGLEKACKDFLKFMYTDEQLRSFTKITGIPKGALNYTMEKSDLDEMAPFQQSIWALRDSSKVVYSGATNNTFYSKQSSLELSANISVFRPFYKGTQYASYWSVMKWNQAKVGQGIAAEIFETGRLSATQW